MAPSMRTPLTEVLGGRTATRLAKIDLHTVADLLRYYPRKYTERGRLTDMAFLRAGEKATLWARIASVTGRYLEPPRRGRRPRHLTKIRVTDGSRVLECAMFNQPWLVEKLPVGAEVLVSGTVSEFRGTVQMSSPEISEVGVNADDVAGTVAILEEFSNGVIPTYPESTGVTSSLLQKCVRHVLEVIPAIADPLPEQLRARRHVIDLDTALRNIHRPAGRDATERATERLRYDEALALQLVLARRRAETRAHPAEPCPRTAGGLLDAFDASLPFQLTDGQRRVGDEIAADLATIHPMNRLLQGEVGSGKTVVALRAMLQVVDSGRQAVLLAPTEVLAAQHARSLREVLGPLGRGGELDAAPGAIAVTLLTGSTGAAARRQALTDIVSGQPGIVVGTHALLSDDVIFTNLGLVVIDEQHRFGVEQRDRLRGGRRNPPHVMVMTATPIPRTVAMTVYGDLDVSTLVGAPVQRAGYSTTLVPALERPGWVDRAWQRIREDVDAGRQAFVVCPRICGDDESADDGDGAGDSTGSGDDSARRPPLAVMDVAEQLRTGPLAGLRLQELHGRMPAADKDAVMRAFAAGDVDVLVTTTVIEVGVDVPNASVMVVLDADRFGMSQLHQLRGRVGRGAAEGLCLLVTEAAPGSTGRDRLEAVAATADGFELAEADLRLRREGDVLGSSQAGRHSSLRLLSLLRDSEVIVQARADATALVGDDPSLRRYPALAHMADAIVDDSAGDYLDKS